MFSRTATYDGLPADRSWLPRSDRGAALLLLCLPLLIGLVCLVGAIVVTLMGPMMQGSFRFYLGAAFYVGVAWDTLCGPWYLLGVIGWALWTRSRGGPAAAPDVILRGLWRTPLITSALAWLPYAFVIPPQHATRFQLSLLILAQLVSGYLWASIARLGLRWWRGM